MYYKSTNKQKLEDYNTSVSQSEGYDGVFTNKWSDIVEHYQGGNYAIKKHPKYNLDANTTESILDFFDPNEDL